MRSAIYRSSISRRNIIKLSLLVAAILNIDKIILGSFSLIRVYDIFDGCFPAHFLIAKSILRYGFTTQFPQMLCGTSSLTFPPNSLAFLALHLIFPLYISYLIYSIIAIFIAFLGMFLLLHDEFKLSEAASFIGALFFSTITIFLNYSIDVVGIPLLIWVFEKIFDNTYSFNKKIIIYFYVIIYFLSSCFVLMAFVLLPFYFSYFLFLSNIKRNAKNILILCSTWSLYFLVNLPALTEIFFSAQNSHRNSWYVYDPISWINGTRNLIYHIFSIDMHGIWGEYISMPSLLGLLLIIYYVISSKKADRDKYFYFPIIWIILIEILSFFIRYTPLWNVLLKKLAILNTFQFDRYFYLLVILFTILIGMASNFLVKKNNFSDKKGWVISLFILFIYICLLLVRYKEFAPRAQIVIQSLGLGVFLILASLKITRRKDISVFSILLISFSVFLLIHTAHSRICRGVETYNHFFGSAQIAKVKELEGNNIDNFRVVKVGGYHPAQLYYNGLKCADGYATLYPLSYKEFWAKVIETELTKSSRYRDYFLGHGNRVYLFDSINKGKAVKELNFNLDLLKLINVKYLFSDKEILNYEKYNLIKIAEKNPQRLTLPKWKEYFMTREFYVYQNKDFAPPVFLTDSVEVFDNKKKLLDELGKREFKYLKTHSFALKEDFNNLSLLDNLNITNSKITDYRLTPDYISVKLDNPYPVVLNWTRNYNKNWLCKIDGKESNIFKVYNSFIGVAVPANSHEVEFRYRNIYFSYACAIALLGFVAINIFVFRYLKRYPV